jgi:hypothetical protein
MFGHFLVHKIHLSDFYVKHKFSFGEINIRTNVRDVRKLFKYLSESLWGEVWILFPIGNHELL